MQSPLWSMLEAVLPLSRLYRQMLDSVTQPLLKVERKTCTNVVVFLVSFLFFILLLLLFFVFVCLFVGRFRQSFLFLECQTSLWTVHWAQSLSASRHQGLFKCYNKNLTAKLAFIFTTTKIKLTAKRKQQTKPTQQFKEFTVLSFYCSRRLHSLRSYNYFSPEATVCPWPDAKIQEMTRIVCGLF